VAQIIDVYHRYQGPINWAKVKAAGVTAAWGKATNGNAPVGLVNELRVDDYAAGAKAAGVIFGVYGYVTQTAGMAADAEALAKEAKRLGAYGLAAMCDYEDASLLTAGDRAHRAPTAANAAKYRTDITAFFKSFKATDPSVENGYLYLPGGWAAAILPGWWPAASDHITTGGMNVYLVDAEYAANTGEEHPRTHYTGAVAVHQYTSVGVVAGVTGKVDRDSGKIVPAKGAASTTTGGADVADLTTQNLADIGHAAAAYEDPTTKEDANQRWTDAAAVLPIAKAMQAQVTGLVAAVAAGFKADAAADTAQSAALANLGTQLTGAQTAMINAVTSLPAPTSGGGMTDGQVSDLASKLAALLGPQDAAAVSAALASITFHADVPAAPNPPQGA
jgi:GH25 family lysozyme M1 (1,4-beta-N-acetylmuramidase)